MNKTLQIALNTFRESVRSRILFTILVFAVLLVALSTFFGKVTIGDQTKVIMNFGLFAISLFSVLFASISGSSFLHKELSRKTIFNILARSVTRGEFLAGKYLGMLFTVTVMVGLMGLALFAFVWLMAGAPPWPLVRACFHIWLELVIICGAAIFFSSIVITPLLSGLFTFGLFMMGRSCEYLLFFLADGGAASGLIIRSIYYALPHLDKINISDLAVHDTPVSLYFTLAAMSYAFAYSAVLFLLALLIFEKREFT